MDYAEEQSMEMEALDSIFMGDFVRTSVSSCEILVQPFSSEYEDQISHVAAKLIVDFPEEYPSVVPAIAVEVTKGLTDAQEALLLSMANESAEENVGSSMVFNIVEALKCWMMDNNVAALSEHELIVKRKLRRSGMATDGSGYESGGSTSDDNALNAPASSAIQNGTMVTSENFSAWKTKFDIGLKERWRIEDEENMDPEASKRISGKQFFESNALSSGFLAAIERECGQEKKFAIDPELYQRCGDLDDDSE